MAILDCLLTFEAPVVAQKPSNVVLGALMHRFPTDKSIHVFCKDHGMADPSITDKGAVWARQFDLGTGANRELQIGWIS